MRIATATRSIYSIGDCPRMLNNGCPSFNAYRSNIFVLWTEKYRPKRLDDLIGNPQAKEVIRSWALLWQSGKPQKPLLLVGPPGVGKTASAYAIANEMRWEVVEMNASDTRSRSAVERVLGAASETSTFFGGRRLILIDEVDGIQGREDVGGVTAIVEIIKKAKQPVILTANDAYAAPVVRIKGLCRVVEFKRVNYRELASYLIRILEKEGIPYEKEAVLELARRENGDVRSALLDLQAIAEKGPVTRETIAGIGYRDRETNIFEVLRTIFKAEHVMRPFRLTATLDMDPDMFKLWIAENVPREYEDPEEVAEAFHWISRADVFDGRIIRRQYWGFLSYSQELLVNGVIVAKKRRYRKFVGYKFPRWIRLLSQYKSKREQVKNIASKIAPVLHVSKKRFIQEYMPLLPLIFSRREWAAHIVAAAKLTAEDVAFIINKSPSSKEVEDIMEAAERVRREVLRARTRKKERKKNKEKKKGEAPEHNVTLFDYARPSK